MGMRGPLSSMLRSIASVMLTSASSNTRSSSFIVEVSLKHQISSAIFGSAESRMLVSKAGELVQLASFAWAETDGVKQGRR